MYDTFDEAFMASRKIDRRTLGSTVFTAALLCLSLDACALGPDGSDDALGTTAAALTEPTGEAVPRATWLAADAGCEGRLDTASPLQFRLAEGEPELRVVLEHGVVLCVDSASAIGDELSGLADDGDGPSEHLATFHRPTAQTAISCRTGVAGADPSPQPSAPQPAATSSETASSRPNGGDPSPQPSDRNRPIAGDPSPQPSQLLRETIDY